MLQIEVPLFLAIPECLTTHTTQKPTWFVLCMCNRQTVDREHCYSILYSAMLMHDKNSQWWDAFIHPNWNTKERELPIFAGHKWCIDMLRILYVYILQTRRSCRVTKRKKYVDELDIQLSDENRSGDEDSVVIDTNDYVNGIPMDQPPMTDIFVVFISLQLSVI